VQRTNWNLRCGVLSLKRPSNVYVGLHKSLNSTENFNTKKQKFKTRPSRWWCYADNEWRRRKV